MQIAVGICPFPPGPCREGRRFPDQSRVVAILVLVSLLRVGQQPCKSQRTWITSRPIPLINLHLHQQYLTDNFFLLLDGYGPCVTTRHYFVNLQRINVISCPDLLTHKLFDKTDAQFRTCWKLNQPLISNSISDIDNNIFRPIVDIQIQHCSQSTLASRG